MKHSLLACAFISYSLLSYAAPTLAADSNPSLGRLFFTPEVRKALQRQRHLNIQEARSLEGSSMRLDGVVVRSSGKSTVWINNRPQAENALETGVAAAVTKQQPERATLVTGDEAPVDLKVGVTVNRSTRETSGGLGDGEIRVRRPAAQK
jgi:hypothetical protein